MIIWLIGMSGTGKTTIGRELWELMRETHENTVFLDGDILRDVWGDTLGHTIEARNKNAHRISHLCKMLDDQGINAVACVLSIFPDWQEWNRKEFTSYYEVFVDTPIEVLEKIDDKGLYAKARNGEIDNVVGVDIPFPLPKKADFIVDNSKRDEAPQDIALRIMEQLRPQLQKS